MSICKKSTSFGLLNVGKNLNVTSILKGSNQKYLDTKLQSQGKHASVIRRRRRTRIVAVKLTKKKKMVNHTCISVHHKLHEPIQKKRKFP